MSPLICLVFYPLHSKKTLDIIHISSMKPVTFSIFSSEIQIINIMTLKIMFVIQVTSKGNRLNQKPIQIRFLEALA